MSATSNLRHNILVLSGKGGVGKSTVAVQVALSLRSLGHRVGLLDLDLCGPSVPRMLGLEAHQVVQTEGGGGWQPVYPYADQSLAVMSIGFLLKDREAAVIWRGPKKHAMINQFLGDVAWGNLDFLVVDTPPGTSDEHISVVEKLRGASTHALLVTTPQAVAVSDVRREVNFCRKMGVPVLGVVENMSGFVCPHCSECSRLFSSGGGTALCELYGLSLLGQLPVDPALGRCLDSGKDYMSEFNDSINSKVLMKIAESVVEQCSVA